MPQVTVRIYRLLVNVISRVSPPDDSEQVAGQSGQKLLIKSDSPKESRRAIN